MKLRAVVHTHPPDPDYTSPAVEICVWRGERCVLVAEIDDELPFDERVEIASHLQELINQE
jgi:hypothetical protein